MFHTSSHEAGFQGGFPVSHNQKGRESGPPALCVSNPISSKQLFAGKPPGAKLPQIIPIHITAAGHVGAAASPAAGLTPVQGKLAQIPQIHRAAAVNVGRQVSWPIRGLELPESPRFVTSASEASYRKRKTIRRQPASCQ